MEYGEKNNFLEYREKNKLRVWREIFLWSMEKKFFSMERKYFFMEYGELRKNIFLAWREEIFS